VAVAKLMRPAQMQKCHQYWKTSNVCLKRGCQRTAQKHFLGGKRSHERTKTNSRCHHQEEVLVLEGYRQAAISLFNELSAFSGTQEFLEVVRSLP